MLACNNIMHDALNATGHVWVPAMIGQMSAPQQPSGPFSIWGQRMTSCCASVDTSGSDTAVSVSVCVWQPRCEKCPSAIIEAFQ